MGRPSSSPRGDHRQSPAFGFAAARLVLLLAVVSALSAAQAAHAWSARTVPAAASATLLHDFDPRRDTTASSLPSGFVTAGSTTFFFAADDIHGRELWKTDGTAGGTKLVAGVNPDLSDDPIPPTQICHPVAIELVVYYCPLGDGEVWRSDGTADGTRRLIRHNPTDASDFSRLTRVGDRLFFISSSGRGSTFGAPALWVSDGTPDGTSIVREFPNGQYFTYTAANDTTFYFAIGGQIWRSDGSAVGTTPILNAAPAGMFTFKGDLFYSIDSGNFATDGLYRSDGTAAGTRRISHANPQGTMLVTGDLVYYYHFGMWRSDGTPEGTFELDSGIVQPWNQAVRGNSLIYAGYSYDIGNDTIWSSDGTLAGTSRLSALDPLLAGHRIISIMVAGDLVFFVTHGPNDSGGSTPFLWRSDLTRDGTFIIWNNAPSYREAFHPAGDALYFVCPIEALGAELCRSDGTVAGTGLVKDIHVDVGSRWSARRMATAGARLFWVPDTEDAELWTSDGTPAGSLLLKQIAPGAAGSDPQELTDVAGTMFFTAAAPAYGRELWRSDGTPDGTRLVEDLLPGSAGSDPGSLNALNGKLLFFTGDGAAQPSVALWSSDGTAAGTIQLKQFPAAAYSFPVRTAAGAELLYFIANDGEHGYELWRSDGTPGGTALLADLAPGAANFSVPTFDADGSRLYFAQYVAQCSCTPLLWTSDGTAAGTRLVTDLRSELPDASISEVTVTGQRAYLTINSPTTQSALWTSDGSAAGTIEVKPGVSRLPVSVGQRVLFPVYDEQLGYELWSSDGSAQATSVVRDIDPGPDGSLYPYHVQLGTWTAPPYQASIVVSASDRLRGYEPWISDGTANGTRLLADIEAGPGSSKPSDWAIAGTTLFVAAFSTNTGAGIWALDLSQAPVNSSPLAADASFAIDGNGTLSGALPGSDGDGDALQFSIVQQGSKGTASILDPARGTFRYVPRAGTSGTDSFRYRVSDGRLEASGTVSITIRGTAAPGRTFLPGLRR